MIEKSLGAKRTTIEEAYEEKKNLEIEIGELLENFRRATGLRVDSIYIKSSLLYTDVSIQVSL